MVQTFSFWVWLLFQDPNSTNCGWWFQLLKLMATWFPFLGNQGKAAGVGLVAPPAPFLGRLQPDVRPLRLEGRDTWRVANFFILQILHTEASSRRFERTSSYSRDPPVLGFRLMHQRSAQKDVWRMSCRHFSANQLPDALLANVGNQCPDHFFGGSPFQLVVKCKAATP